MEFFKHTLPNGIRCIHKRMKSPVAYCALTINAGSRDETAKEHGAAHFVEHMLFKGTENRKAYQINSRLERLGGELNAFTTKEETVVHATTLKGDLPKAAELISDVAFNSTFPARELAKETEVIVDEINSYKDSPPDRIYDEFEDMLFAGSDLGHNILGTEKSVSLADTHLLKDFTERCYNTDQMVLSVGGNLSEAAFVKLAERYFGGRQASLRRFSRQAPATISRFEKSVNRNTHQAHCILGGRAYDNKASHRVTLALLVNVLGGPAANSMLNVLLREKNGLTYNVEASYTPYCDTGIAAIYFGTDKGRTDRCLELIDKQLCALRNTALTTRQLAAAKKQFIGQLAISMEGKEGYMLSAAKSLLVYGDVDSQEDIYKKVRAITAADILAVANDVFAEPSVLIYK